MSAFEDYVYERAREGVLSIPPKIAADIYAVSFYFWADEDDPRRAMLTVGYNTNARWQSCTPAPGQPPKWPIASSSEEAKWNFAFWLQEDGTAAVVGDTDADASAREEWIKSLECWFTDEDEDEDFDHTIDLGNQIMSEFVNLCMRVAARLHNDGVVKSKFGRDVPVIIHELEYHDQIAQATEEANPPGLTREFSNWIASM
jgi:hypothetical protein